jgi:hypothetical protein
MPDSDPHVSSLARHFREHPAWQTAARHLEESAASAVFFSHLPDEVWHLERREGQTLLLPGPVPDPDFAFRFTPDSIERLVAVRGSIGDFAVELFQLMAETRPRLHVDFRIRAPFTRILRRGYLGLLAAGGTRVLAFGAAHGVRTIAALRRLVEQSRRAGPEPWEADLAPHPRGPRGPAAR